MIVPQRVNILGTYFLVHEKPLEGTDCGQSYIHTREIFIDAGLTDAVKVETFYHEVVHMLLAHLGLNAGMTDHQEEQFAQALGMALTHFISTNELPGVGGMDHE